MQMFDDERKNEQDISRKEQYLQILLWEVKHAMKKAKQEKLQAQEIGWNSYEP